MLRFKITTLLVVVSLVAFAVVPCAEYFGWIYPPRRVSKIIKIIESHPAGLPRSEFLSATALSDTLPLRLQGLYTWNLDDGFTLLAQFDSESNGSLQYASISFSPVRPEQRPFLWRWHRDRSTVKNSNSKGFSY